MFSLVVAALCISADPQEVPRHDPAGLPAGAIARFGGNRFTALQSLDAIEFGEDAKVLHGWDGQTLYRWEFPSGRPLQRLSVPQSVNPTGHPFAYTALAPGHAQVAWIRFQNDKEHLQVWDFHQKKLILDCDITLTEKNLDYAGLAWSDDAAKLLTVLNNKQVHVYDRQGMLIEKTMVTDGKGLELPGGKRLRNSGPIKDGVLASIGKSRLRIATSLEQRVVKEDTIGKDKDKPENFPRPTRIETSHVLTFVDLDSGKKDSVRPVPDFVKPGFASVSKDGRHLAIADASRIRIWEVATRRELELPYALPEIGPMVVSPGGGFVQFQRDPLEHKGTPWFSLNLKTGRVRELVTPAPIEGITLGLSAKGFAVGKDQFIAITGRSLDHWDLETGRRLAGMPLPKTPHVKEFGAPYDECLLLGDGFRLVQFTSFAERVVKNESVFRSTWRVWSPEQKDAALRTIPDCTWQRGAAMLPQGRFLYFATPPALPTSKDTEVQPGVTFRQRGEMQLYLGRLDRPDLQHRTAFGGYWPELRGAGRGGQMLLLFEFSSTWIQTSRNSQSTWFDPEAQRHCLLDFHSGEPVDDSKAFRKTIGAHASYLSADGRFLLLASENKLRLYEPYVLGKVVKEFPLPATPKRFALSSDGTRIACQLDDATLMIWDAAPLTRAVDEALAHYADARGALPPRPQPLAPVGRGGKDTHPKDLTRLVDELASSPNIAYRAARLLAAAGDQGVAALRQGIHGKGPDATQIAGWIRDLDSATFAARDKAELALAGWSTPVEKALRAALNANPSVEKRARLQRLLARLAQRPLGNRELAQARAVLALDWNGSPAAVKLLSEWTETYPDSVLASESKIVVGKK